jgi:lipopolysaccharide export system protein LptA
MQSFSRNFRAASIIACVVASAAPAWAERADRDKPLNYEADSVRADDLRQTQTFSGNVVLTKGTLVIRAAKVDIKRDADGYLMATATSTPAKRVFYRQKREGVDEFMEAEAETMEYNERADTLQFARSAVMRRYRGATLADEASGAVIFYDNKTETFSVDGQPSAGAGATAGASSGGRVRGVLTPRPSAVGVAPASPAPGPALKASSSAAGAR